MIADLTVFYADDDADDLDFFKEAVEEIQGNFDVVTHNRGDKLLSALQNPPPMPQIIFLDLNMPGKNGFEVLQEIRLTESFKEIPVVIFSTSGDEGSISKSRNLGASFYIQKSSCFDTFKKSIKDTLGINWKTFAATNSNFLYQ